MIGNVRFLKMKAQPIQRMLQLLGHRLTYKAVVTTELAYRKNDRLG